MLTEKLNNQNRATLKSDILQICLSYIVVSIVVAILLGAVYILIDRIDLNTIEFSKSLLFWGIFSIVIIAYLGYIFKTLRPSFLDLVKNKKIIQSAVYVS